MNNYLNKLIIEHNASLKRQHYKNRYRTSLEKNTYKLRNKPIKNINGYIAPKKVRGDILELGVNYIKNLHYRRNQIAFNRFYVNDKMPKLWQRNDLKWQENNT